MPSSPTSNRPERKKKQSTAQAAIAAIVIRQVYTKIKSFAKRLKLMEIWIKISTNTRTGTSSAGQVDCYE